MNYKAQLGLAGSAFSTLFGGYLAYKYTVFYGKITPISLISIYLIVIVNIVDTGHRAIKFNKISGVRPQVYKEGYHLMYPWFERPIVYDVRTHPTVIKSMTGSKGNQLIVSSHCIN